MLFHYNGHGVPRPTANGEVWVFNKSYTQYIPLSVFDLQARCSRLPKTGISMHLEQIHILLCWVFYPLLVRCDLVPFAVAEQCSSSRRPLLCTTRVDCEYQHS